MQPRTREVLDYLNASDVVLDEAIAAVPVGLRERRPAPDRWSAAEVLEHLGIVEGGIVQMLGQRVDAARERGLGRERDTAPVVPTVAIERLLDREAKLVASERSHPKAGLDWRAAREALAAARARTRELLLASDGLALSELVIPHPVLGPQNVYQWLVFLGGHERRHAAQIREAGGAFA